MVRWWNCCSYEQCTNQAKKKEVFVGDTQWALKELMGIQTRKRCSHEGCNSFAQLGESLLYSWRAKRKRCSHERCSSFAKKKGVCVTHGAKVEAAQSRRMYQQFQKGWSVLKTSQKKASHAYTPPQSSSNQLSLMIR